MGNYIVGMTDASGAIYAEHLIKRLLGLGMGVHVCMTDAAKLVARTELVWETDRMEGGGKAEDCLKERRPLVAVPREAPYNPIHLENMLALSRYGAVIMPASPAFYSGPQTIEALVDFFVVRLLDQLGLRGGGPAANR